MTPRTKLALKQNTVVGVPVIVAEALFSTLNVSVAQHFLLAAFGGYAVSLVFVYATLRAWKMRAHAESGGETPSPQTPG